MKRMLSAPEIYLYRESVDFRKSINGLAAIIESDTDLPLGSGALFLFTNKQRDGCGHTLRDFRNVLAVNLSPRIDQFRN